MSSTPSVRLYNARTVNRLDVLATLAVGQSSTAPNYVQVTGAEAGSAPVIAALGPDASVPLTLSAKADAPVNLLSNGQLSAEFNSPSNAVNALSISSAATGQSVAIRTVGSDTNRGIMIVPGGTASLTVTGPAVFQGAVTLPGAPTNPLHAATRAYVDSVVIDANGIDLSAYLETAGGTMTGALILTAPITAGNHAVTKTYVDNATQTFTDNYLAKTGGTMTGAITLSGAPSSDLHASTKKYVDDGLALKLNLAGGTLTGDLTLDADPTSDLHAATKQYVDDLATVQSVASKTGAVTLVAADITDFDTAAATAVTIPFEAGLYVKGKPDAAEVLIRHTHAHAVRFATNLAGCAIKAGTAATGSSVFTFEKNGVSFGTLTVGASGTTATAAGTQTDMSIGDILTITAPSSQDTTLADLGITIAGVYL